MTDVLSETRDRVARVKQLLGDEIAPFEDIRSSRPMRLLLLEDDPIDRVAMKRALGKMKSEFTLLEAGNVQDALRLVETKQLDLALIDYDLPDGNAEPVLGLLVLRGVPAIVVTGEGSERLAATLLAGGATDYVIKDVAGSYLQLIPSRIERAREQSLLERERDKLFDELANMIETVNMLKGLVPVCAECKKIRNKQGDWNDIEEVISNTYHTAFSHGLCPDCYQRERIALEQDRREH